MTLTHRSIRPLMRPLALGALSTLIGCDESGALPLDLVEDGGADAVVEVDAPDAGADVDAASLPGTYVPAEAQPPGDPARGFETLAEGAYVGCGIPAELYPVAERAGLFGDEPTLPGRDDILPYHLSRFVSPRGVEVIGPNCFSCHAGEVAGELILGAPGIDLDFGGFAEQITRMQSQVALLDGVLEPASFEELDRFVSRFAAVAPYVQTEVIGVNPADNLAAALFAHRDPVTLEWHDEPLLTPPEEFVVPADVPPLWRMKKKHAMLYTAAGRGDHARIMMTTSTLCVDTVAEAEAIYEAFKDVRAWIYALEAPRWPEDKLGPIDGAKASAGETVFGRECAQCHGTYGATDADDTYPNLWIPVDRVRTDDLMATGGVYAAIRFVEWFNASLYGKTARLEPALGYVAPPLDGIWATAPFLHNGSVPTLAALLDSSTRPRYWRRLSGFDQAAVGLLWTPSEVGHAQMVGGAKRSVYDTTLLGHSNSGHLFGDTLTPSEREAVIEYLKTL